jgi:hypothetical protein
LLHFSGCGCLPAVTNFIVTAVAFYFSQSLKELKQCANLQIL